MKPRISLLLLVALSLFLEACSADDNSPAAEPALEIITLQTTPSLAHWLPEVAACANALSGVGVYTSVLPIGDLDPTAADLTVRLGNPLDTDPFVTVLGTENLVIIAGPEMPVTSMSLESLQAISAGEITDWRDVPEAGGAGLTDNAPITLLSFPQGNDLRSHFTDIYLESGRLTDNVKTFSTVDTLTTLLEENPTAISYALSSQVPSMAQVLPITGREGSAPEIYVIAVTQNEPQGAIRSLLLCLQDAP
jgi:hypothetical protein